ncbi:putative RING-H2 finger protein ATL21A [Olea europaea var. sylvestris]|uniref:putative RING-H2 finger protein ATL21A n=1 Tax=Olea europaea var. sylvestris TaxID=158386 RepID=UPI000C1CCEA4|nr:putative RING-H2 finger protein ATL21A [Olea europaea var. sylvestris]
MKILELHLLSFSRKSILNFLIFFFFFVCAVHSKDQCSTSSCGDGRVDIKYPFNLSGQKLENCEYINLKCVNENITSINLPYSGEFYVQDIYYGLKIIQVYDPSNCLPRRLLNLNLSSSLLGAIEYQEYTFYSCPQDLLESDFTVIDCLSNSTSATVATSFASRELMEGEYMCKLMFTSSIPVSPSQLDPWGSFSNLQLVWNDLSCKDCEGTDGSRSKLSKFLALAISMPGIVIISTFCCLASCMQLFNLVRDKFGLFGTGAPPQANMFPSIVPPQATMFPGDAPPQTTSSVPIGLDDSKIKSCTELVVLNEGQSISGSESNACPICLEGYRPEETVRCISVCKHGFHANCIEQWLRKNGTCPVCRTLVSDDEQVVAQDILITTHVS